MTNACTGAPGVPNDHSPLAHPSATLHTSTLLSLVRTRLWVPSEGAQQGGLLPPSPPGALQVRSRQLQGEVAVPHGPARTHAYTHTCTRTHTVSCGVVCRVCLELRHEPFESMGT